MSYKITLMLAAHYRWNIHQMNIKSAFLHGELDKEVYIKLPEDFASLGNKDLVCKL